MVHRATSFPDEVQTGAQPFLGSQAWILQGVRAEDKRAVCVKPRALKPCFPGNAPNYSGVNTAVPARAWRINCYKFYTDPDAGNYLRRFYRAFQFP